MSSEGAHGRLIVISGPSASGKSTLWRRLVQHAGVEFSVSATTRPPRPGEESGCDYRFLSEGEFQRLLGEGAFLEHAEVHGRRYGTLRSDVETAIRSGKDILVEIDVQGADQVRRSGLPMVSLFVMPPSLAVLEQRLRDRRTEDEEQIQRRLGIAAAEMEHADEYDHVILNDDVERMVAEAERLLGLEVSA